MNSNQAFGYQIDSNTDVEGLLFKLEPKPLGPRLRVISFEWDADTNTGTMSNNTRIMVFVDSNSPLDATPNIQLDPNIIGVEPVGMLDPEPPELIGETIVAGRRIKPHYETVYSDYAGKGIHKAGLLISAADVYGTTELTYIFHVDSNTVASDMTSNNEGGTTLPIIPAIGGKTGDVGLIDMDNDGIYDDYDESFLDVPVGALIGGTKGMADPNFDELSRLFIKIERPPLQGENTITAQYDIQILNKKGDKAANVQINKKRPITVYLHFDPTKFDGDLANIVIKYFDSITDQWQTEGIKNIRVIGNTIAFEIEHVTVFGAFSSRPTKLSAIVNHDNDRIDIGWQDNSSNETGFEIYRKVNNEVDFTLPKTVAPNIDAYSDPNCIYGKTHYYKVRAVTPFGPTEFSNEASATMPLPPLPDTLPPISPTNLTITKISETEIKLTWQDNSDDESGFKIYRKREDESTYSLIGTTGANIEAYTDKEFAKNKQYEYYIVAYNSAGDSIKSNTVNYTVPVQNITAVNECFISVVNKYKAETSKWASKYANGIQKLFSFFGIGQN